MMCLFSTHCIVLYGTGPRTVSSPNLEGGIMEWAGKYMPQAGKQPAYRQSLVQAGRTQ